MKNTKNKGFTLAEVLITLALLGVVMAITIPTLTRIRPDKKKMFFKKAYYTLEQTVANMINDEMLYPEIYDDNGDPVIGFRNLNEDDTYGCQNDSKFPCLFSKQLNTIDVTEDNPYIIEGNDGIIWYVEKSKFDSSDNNSVSVTFDVNGEKEPNSSDNSDNQDQFKFKVYFDGRIEMDCTGDECNKTKEYLRSTSAMK